MNPARPTVDLQIVTKVPRFALPLEEQNAVRSPGFEPTHMGSKFNGPVATEDEVMMPRIGFEPNQELRIAQVGSTFDCDLLIRRSISA